MFRRMRVCALVGMGVLTFSLSFAARLEGSGRFQAEPSGDRPIDLSKWDGSSRILDRNGNVLTRVTVRNGKIDFSRAADQTREALLETLYEKGVRQIYCPLDQLAVTSQGRLGMSGVSDTGLFQALHETPDGLDLANGEGSEILDDRGKVLATVATVDGKPFLTCAAGQSLRTLHDAGLRWFYYKVQVTNGKLTGRAVSLTRSDKGEVKLE